MIGLAKASGIHQTNTNINFRDLSRPTFSPEHGVLIVLFGSFIIGASLAQAWNYCTTIALTAAFFALQVEHPLVVQIKRRSSIKPRFILWTGIYGTISLTIGFWLWMRFPDLIWVYGLILLVLIVDVIAVVKQKHKSIGNELAVFAAICLSSPLAYIATGGSLSEEKIFQVGAVWILNTLFFSSAIFTIKLRRKKTSSLSLGVVYHLLASLIVTVFYILGWLNLVTALAFSIAVIEFITVICFREWYCQARFMHVAMLETRFALIYIAVAAISLLPARLPVG